MKTYVIGDIHGCFTQLEKLLEEINPNLRKERLVFLGDYIDRGPDSYQVLRKLMELQKRYGKKQVVLLRGNHEQMALDYLSNKANDNWLYNGGNTTLRDFAENDDHIENYKKFLQGLPLYFEDEHFICVHAGIRYGISLSQQRRTDLLWLRGEFYENPEIEEKPVVFGHTPTIFINETKKPYMVHNRIGIDTGCVYGGCLSALELEDGLIKRIIQIGEKEVA